MNETTRLPRLTTTRAPAPSFSSSLSLSLWSLTAKKVYTHAHPTRNHALSLPLHAVAAASTRAAAAAAPPANPPPPATTLPAHSRPLRVAPSIESM